MACLCVLSAAACDLPDKNIGDETMGDGGDPGECEPGETVPADDGCNTCICQDDGTLSCTEIDCAPECEPGEVVPAADGCNTCECNDDGTIGGCTEIACSECTEGDSMPADDGCNTCDCVEGEWACTRLACEPECEPGEVVPSDDGCNTCECNDDGTIGACTAVACDPGDEDPFDGQELAQCGEDVPFDDLEVIGLTPDGDTLIVDVAYTGCGPGHPLGGCWDGSIAESDPEQVWIQIAHDDLGEACDAFPSDQLTIDLGPLRQALAAGPGDDVVIHLAGWDEPILFTFE